MVADPVVAPPPPPTPPSYVAQSSVGVTVNVATINVPVPSGATAEGGDLLLALCTTPQAGNTSWNPTVSGKWTQIAADSSVGTTLFARITDASGEATTWGFTRSPNGASQATATIVRIKPGDDPFPVLADLIAAAGVAGTTASVNTITLPSLSVSGNVLLYQILSRPVLGTVTWTPPGTVTEDFDTASSSTAHGVAGGHETVGSGGTGTRAWGVSTSGLLRGGVVAINL
jgi:hypothetical protein